MHALADELRLLDLDPWLAQQPLDVALLQVHHPQVPFSVVDVSFDQQPPAVVGEVVAKESGTIHCEQGPGLAGGGRNSYDPRVAPDVVAPRGVDDGTVGENAQGISD